MSTRTGPPLPHLRAALGISFCAAALSLAGAPSGHAADAQVPSEQTVDTGHFTVVVNASRPALLKRRQVADLFLTPAQRWPDGTPVAVVDLSVNDTTRAAFSKGVLEQTTAAVVHHWQRQMLTGRVMPPLVRTQDAALALIARTPGAIGYVASDATLPDGVKVVKLVE
jgi:ABC-type phosphate transport system substrate-binding protein